MASLAGRIRPHLFAVPFSIFAIGLPGCGTDFLNASRRTAENPALARTQQPPPAKYHQIRAGETLDDIAATYGVSADRLREVNGREITDGLKPGENLFIPHEP